MPCTVATTGRFREASGSPNYVTGLRGKTGNCPDQVEVDAADAYGRALLYVLQKEPAAAAASGVKTTS